MIKKIQLLLGKYISLGADDTTTKNELKKIQLLHIFCNTWHLFTLFSFIEDYIKDQLIISSYLFMVFLVISIQWLLYRKKYYIASIFFLFNLFSVTLYYSNYLYKAELMEYYFILPFAISLIYIDNKKINFLILIVCLLALFIPNYYYKHYPFSVFNNQNVPFLFFSIYVIINYFKSLNIRNEKILEAKTKELEALDKFKSQFFTNISHEIRTPLTLINGQISDLEQFATNTPCIANIQTGIKKQISSITNMVDDVLDLAKMQSSNFSLQLKPTNISDSVRKQYLNFEPLFKQKNIDFNISKNTEDYIAHIDPVFFERAINNIIINALKYTDNGLVNINISKENQWIHISISDTGIGIDKNDLDRIFNRFYQVNNDINKSGGSGVGLAFSKEIIELHDGKLLLQSDLNKGSTFTIVLPLIKSIPTVSTLNTTIETEKKPIEKLQEKTSNATFLIVDDNYDMRQYLIAILKHYNCLQASNGLEALKIIEHTAIDFIITDYMMPKLNGYEFVTKLKENNTNTPIIMLTAKTDANTKLDVLKLGIDDYITKPFEKDELLVRIDNSIKNSTSRNTYNKEHHIETCAPNDPFLEALKLYVYKNSSNNELSQDLIAQEFNISKSSFYRKIKSNTGLSPNSFIKEIRLQKAREILKKNPSILLKQLALEVGFSHYSYFSKEYKKRFGVKPVKNC